MVRTRAEKNALTCRDRNTLHSKMKFTSNSILLLTAIGISCIVLALIFTANGRDTDDRNFPPQPSSSFNWRMFRGGQVLSGVATGKLSDSLKLYWKFKTGGEIKSSPAIEGGSVYIGSDDGKVYAIDLSNGQKIWSYQTGDAVESSPCVLNGSVFVGSADSFLYALDAKAGRLKWKYKTGAKILGSPNWAPSPKKDKTWILVGSYDNKLHCVGSATGELIWTYETGNYINGAPAITDGKAIFGGCDAKIHVVSIVNGKGIAQIDTGSYIAGSSASADKYAFAGNYGGKVVCVDLDTKTTLWTYEGKDSPFFSSPAVGENQVVLGSRDKRLHCIRRNNGKFLWAFQAQGKIDSSPVVCDGKVVTGSDDGSLYIVNLSDGKEVWSYEIGSALTGSPAVANGIVVIGSEDGYVYAFGPRE